MDNRLFEAVEKLAVCQFMCNKCFNACLCEEDVKMLANCIRTDRQCADFCAFTISSLTRCDCDHIKEELIKLCIAVCKQCAEECRKHEHIHCQECAEACDDCIEACKRLITPVEN